jgi:two-component system, OmpR family, KDP operon response regulator KdpE
MSILKPVVVVIEDNAKLRRLLRRSLKELDFDVRAADSGRAGLTLATHSKPDLILLDLGLPEPDGLDIIRKLRQWWSSKPIIVLSDRIAEIDKVAALDLGADDYVVKPFGLSELLARVRAVMRRASRHSHPDDAPEFRSHGVTVDILNRKVGRDGVEIKLTPNEFRVLSILVRNCGLLVTTDTLVSELWGPTCPPTSLSCLRTYVSSLRKKLEKDPTGPQLLLTEPGIGYRVALDPQPVRSNVGVPPRKITRAPGATAHIT